MKLEWRTNQQFWLSHNAVLYSWCNSVIFLICKSLSERIWHPAKKKKTLTSRIHFSPIGEKWMRDERTPKDVCGVAWVSGVSGGKGERWKRKRKRALLPPPPSSIKNLLSPIPLGRPDTQAICGEAKLGLGSISTVSRVRSLILPEERLIRGMSVGSFSRTAAGNRA